MSHFKISEIVENWDSIVLSYDAQPKEKLIQADDYDELTERFFSSIFGTEEEEINEDFMNDEYGENARSFYLD